MRKDNVMQYGYEVHAPAQGAIGAQANWFRLDFFHQGFIDKVVVKQLGGTPTPYIVRIYNSKRPLPPGSLSSGTQDPDGRDPDGIYTDSPETYWVLRPYTMGAGELLFDLPHKSYKNMDGKPINVPITPERFIYVVIEPELDGDSTWDIAIGGYYFD